MKINQQAVGWILAAFMVVTLSIVCLVQWRSNIIDSNLNSIQYQNTCLNLDRKLELASSRWNSLQMAMAEELSSVRALLNKFAEFQPDAMKRSQDNINYLESNQKIFVGPSEGKSAVPPIPDGLNAEQTMTLALKDLESDSGLNPKQKKLNRIEVAKVMAEQARAQGLKNILDSEIIVEVAQAMEQLRLEKAYIEYAKGEKYEILEGVMTAAEPIEEGARMFYFYPERFPEIYDKKELKKQIIDTSLRKLWALFNDEGTRSQ